MSNNKTSKTPLNYSRKRNAVEINGDPTDVKRLALLDLILTKGWSIILTMILLFTLPKASLLPFLWQYLKSRWLPFLILLVVKEEYLLRLSG